MSERVNTERSLGAPETHHLRYTGFPLKEGWSLVVAVNDESVLQSTLLASPAIDARCQVLLQRSFSCAGEAYNAGLTRAQHEVVVFAHQDVYLPERWPIDLNRALTQLEQQDPEWGILGVFGVTSNERPELKGYCYSTGLQRILGAPFNKPIPAVSLDELVLVLRRSSGLRFDQKLPGFHLYGTDICAQARTKGLNCYITSAFCIHNSNGLKFYPRQYWKGYLYLRKKWREHLPFVTCCSTITRFCFPMVKQIAADLKKRLLGFPRVGTRVTDVSELYRRIAQELDRSAPNITSACVELAHQDGVMAK